MTKQSCSTCRYWRQGDFKLGDGVHVGDCRRSPPRIVRELNPFADEDDHRTSDREINAYHATVFPVLAADDWCGEHETSAGKAADTRRAAREAARAWVEGQA